MEGLNTCELPPGFRFHPTDEELVTHYLSPKVLDCNFTTKAVGEVDLYKLEPWDLPWRAKMGEKEWYFFCVRDKKYPTGSRTNRATNAGYWKATGKDKEVFRAKILVGMKKTLVFYSGRAPIGEKTNWVMHEYRLHGKNSNILPTTTKKEWVICRVFKKTSGGNKAHISGLEGRNNPRFDLPPLVDLSYEEKARNCGEGPHVTCFSNLNPQHKSADIYSSSSSDTEFVYPSSVFSSQLGQCTGDFHWPEYVLKQEHRRVCHSYMKHDATAEFSQDDASTISMYEAALTPYNDDQDLPIISTGQMIDLDCLWNY